MVIVTITSIIIVAGSINYAIIIIIITITVVIILTTIVLVGITVFLVQTTPPTMFIAIVTPHKTLCIITTLGDAITKNRRQNRGLEF